jgi:hypothetical protein
VKAGGKAGYICNISSTLSLLIHTEDGRSRFLRNVGNYQTIRRHIPE